MVRVGISLYTLMAKLNMAHVMEPEEVVSTVHPRLSEAQLSNYQNRETMASLWDLNHFIYPNTKVFG